MRVAYGRGALIPPVCGNYRLESVLKRRGAGAYGGSISITLMFLPASAMLREILKLCIAALEAQ